MGRPKREIVWEYYDIAPSNSHKYRNYTYVFNALYDNILSDATANIQIEIYPKDKTDLGYDVYFKYQRFPSDDIIESEHIKIYYKTSFMDDYQYMVGYYTHESEEDKYKNINIRNALIRANAGHVLDIFFGWYLTYKYSDKPNLSSYLNSFYRDYKDEDPTDYNGVNFKDNPEYLNGGYYYNSVSLNDFIISFAQLGQTDRNILLYDGNLLDENDEKVLTFIDNWLNSFDVESFTDEKLDQWFDGLKKFWNTYVVNQVTDVWFKWYDIDIQKKEQKVWHNGESYTTISLNIKDSSTGKINIFSLPYQDIDGRLNRSYWNDSSKERIVNVFEYFDDAFFKKMVIIKYMAKNYISTNCYEFIEKIHNKYIPETYIDLLLSLQNSSDEFLNDKIDLCMGLVVNTFLNDDICNYSQSFFDNIDYFVEYIVTEPSFSKYFRYMKSLLQPFEYFKNNLYESIGGASETYNISKNFKHINEIIEPLLQLIYATKCVHQIHKDNILTKVLYDCCDKFTIDTDTIDMSEYDFSDYGTYVETYQSYVVNRYFMVVDIVSKTASINTNILPHKIFDILKLHAIHEIKRTVKKLEEGESEYCGRVSSKRTNKHSENLINIVNLLINKIAKDNDNKTVFEKTITAVNRIIGGSVIIKSTENTIEYMKILSFFLLCSDRYDESMVDRLLQIIDKQTNLQYPSICGVTFNTQIKYTIRTIFVKLWENKMNDTHFDVIEGYLREYFDKESVTQWSDLKSLYIITNDKIKNYLEGI